MHQARKIKVLVVDDSALMRQMLTAILHQDPSIQVVGTATDPHAAREKIKQLKPDVLTLDVEMPHMDGLTFLEKLMRLHPMPVVMVSSLTAKGAETTLRALELGAVDFVAKPRDNARETLPAMVDEICSKVQMAARAHVRAQNDRPSVLISSATPATDDASLIAIGASAGGTQAIAEVLTALPAGMPGMVVVQHMPPKFTALFAANLNNRCALSVREARDGERVERGSVLIAPGGLQMALRRDTAGYYVYVYEGAPVNLHRPAVDVLFDSTARFARADALGILLTGMGSDGAKGLLAMRQAGAHTIAQDEASSVVFGMPDQAIRLGAARDIVGLDQLARRIVQWAGTRYAASA